MSRAPSTVQVDHFDLAQTVAYLHQRGLTHISERSVTRATYEGRKLLKRVRIGSRTYWTKPDIDSWLEHLRTQSGVRATVVSSGDE